MIARLRPQMAQVAGATLYLSPAQEIRAGGRQSNSLYQYTLQADDLGDLRSWTPKLVEALKTEPALTDVNSDQQDKGLESYLVIDRDTASRLGLTASQVDNTLNDAFAQRQVSTIYESLNQYHVIMVVAPRYWQDPETLRDVFVSTSAASITGSQSTNAVAGTVAVQGRRPSRPPPRSRPTRPATPASTPSPRPAAAPPRRARPSARARRRWSPWRPSPTTRWARRRSR